MSTKYDRFVNWNGTRPSMIPGGNLPAVHASPCASVAHVSRRRPAAVRLHSIDCPPGWYSLHSSRDLATLVMMSVVGSVWPGKSVSKANLNSSHSPSNSSNTVENQTSSLVKSSLSPHQNLNPSYFLQSSGPYEKTKTNTHDGITWTRPGSKIQTCSLPRLT